MKSALDGLANLVGTGYDQSTTHDGKRDRGGRMSPGKLVSENEGVFVDYEVRTVWHGKRRLTTGRCVLRQTPGPKLSKALSDQTAANLVPDKGEPLNVEFTGYTGGNEVEFCVNPSTGYGLDR